MSSDVDPDTGEVRLSIPSDEMQIKFHSDETIVFASSSGHCNLDCAYCVIVPVVKQQPSLTFEDFRFMRDQIAGKVFFILSGKGDFFAGFSKSDRLLNRLLELEDVAVALDVNGVAIHGFSDLDAAALAKIRHINLTFHYKQLVQHNALKVWLNNALTMLRMHDSSDFFLNLILSPAESHLWVEAIEWYEANLFAQYPKRLVLINDVNRPFGPAHEAVMSSITERFPHVLQSVRRGNFEQLFQAFDHVRCPAGQSYFRLWNDGTVDACPNVPDLRASFNVKRREFARRTERVACQDVRYCDCYHVATAGQMKFYRGPMPLAPATGAAARRTIAISPAG